MTLWDTGGCVKMIFVAVVVMVVVVVVICLSFEPTQLVVIKQFCQVQDKKRFTSGTARPLM